MKVSFNENPFDGAPGSGKGTQAGFIADKVNVSAVSSRIFFGKIFLKKLNWVF